MPVRVNLCIALIICFVALIFGSQAEATTPPPASEVFKISVERSNAGELRLQWVIAPGHYLYRDSLRAKIGGRNLTLALPPSESKDDPNFGAVQVYHHDVETKLTNLPATGEMEIVSQGCAEQGICYPPQKQVVDLETLAIRQVGIGLGGQESARAEDHGDPSPVATAVAAGSETDLTPVLGGGLVPMLGAFLAFGLLLSLTPCIFPMIPILSAILAGAGGRLSAGRGFSLSFTYVLAMATAYGLVGFVAGLTGANLQAALQTPWALGLAAATFVVLSLSMFGFFDLALPAGFATRLSGSGGGGSFAKAALLGFGSALIVGPCVTPPLAAAMLYAVQTGEAGKGGVALFALGLGMGLPLVVAGTFGAGILPKAGPWLDSIKPIFGTVFLATAIMLAARLLPGSAALALWGSFAIGVAAFLGGFDRLDSRSGARVRLGKAMGFAAAIYGTALIVGAAGGASDLLHPLSFFTSSATKPNAERSEIRLSSLADFDKALTASEAGKHPVLVSFTADWCTVCKSNEAVMADPAIRKRLNTLPTIIADVTSYGADTRALMARYAVVGPPTLILLDKQGHEIPGSRLTGPVTEQSLQTRLTQAGV